MSGNASITSVCNQALSAVGARSFIANLNEGTVEANNCALWYQPVFQQLARSAKWNCLRAQANLSLLAAATGTPENPTGTNYPQPPTPWLYSYQIPSNSLAIRFLVPSLPFTATGTPPTPASVASPINIPGQGQIPYAIASGTDSNGNAINILLTNQSRAQAVYTIDQENPALWDSQFQMGFVMSLAAFLVPALSLDKALMQIVIKSAEGIIAQARAADGNEAVVCQDHIPDWLLARSGGTGFGLYGGWNVVNFGTNENMCWPGY